MGKMEKDKTHSLVNIPVGEVVLKGNLVIPKDPVGLVIFSHGSGSSRLSPRNNFVAGKLNDQHFATLLFDLLTLEEDSIYENRFDIELLTERLAEATHWIAKQPDLDRFAARVFRRQYRGSLRTESSRTTRQQS